MQQQTNLQRYEQSTALRKEQATEILKSIWPRAPETEVYKAALICESYGLNPLLHHLALVPFKNKKTNGVDWVIIMAIKATRLIAARKKAFSYIEDTPRLMTTDEQQSILGEVDTSKIWAITILQDAQGNIARGYGFWPKELEPHGTEKGNTKLNMAMIRSERQAVDRMVPDALPQGVEIMEDTFMPPVSVEPSTGELLETEVETVEPEPPGVVEPVATTPAVTTYLGGQYGDMLRQCWQHGEPWKMDNFHHLSHRMPDKTFCQFRDLLKPITEGIAKKLGITADDINERAKQANQGKTWSKLSEESQLEILTVLSSQIPIEDGDQGQGELL